MAYELIKKFKEILAGDPPFTARAAISPLFLTVTWQEEKNPLHILSMSKGRDHLIAVNEKNYIAIATDKFSQYFKNKITLEELQNEYDSWESKTGKLYEELSAIDLSKLTDHELKDYIHKINGLFLELARKTIYIENVDYEKTLGVIGIKNKEMLDAIWDTSTQANFISFENRRLKKMLDLIESDQNNLIWKAKYIFTDYFWIKTDSEVSNHLDEIRTKLSEKKEEYNQAAQLSEDRQKKYNEWLATLNNESKRLAQYLQLVMHLRDLRKDPLAQIQTMLAEISTEMLKRAHVDTNAAPYVILYEYMRGISHLVSIKDEIETRSSGHIYLANPDLTYHVERCDFEKALEEFEAIASHDHKENDTLKGQIACRGNVRGVVRVIFDPHDDKGFQKGDILVTSMTRPEFVPLMKLAGAVVTNEGGITCHAAIVSRELNIPCIIGTKIATRVLKDWDMVEVDADNGVVRIIK